MLTNTTWNQSNIFKICNLSPEYSVKDLQEMIKKQQIVPNSFNEAIFNYNHTRNPNLTIDDPDFFPLKFISIDGETQVWISGVTSGYDVTGPQCTLRCLRMMGFKLDEFDEHRLFSEYITNITYRK